MKLIRKLIVGISTICLLVMTFVSATYAWFEINSRASVENFHFEVHGGQGFLVSIDNVNYYNDLNLLQLQKAMLVAYGDGEYRLATDGSETIYHIEYGDAYDAYGNYTPYEILKPIDDQNINEIVAGTNGIKLLPTTSTDGRYLTDLYNSESKPNAGKYVQFSIYFRTQSRRKQDNFAYDIYLNGEDGMADDGSLVEPTKITSSRSTVPLSADMDAVINTANGKEVVHLKRNKDSGQRDSISVYSSNAIRLSVTNQEYFVEYKTDGSGNIEIDENGNKVISKEGYKLCGDNPTRIYELNDTENLNTDLGSYATNYDEYMQNPIFAQDYTLDDHYLYESSINAMYTYYNNLKPDAKLSDRLLNYDVVKNMNVIRSLDNKDTITRVVAGEEAKLLTFRLWLEGWDADCFDGIEYAVKVRLAFGSKRVDL